MKISKCTYLPTSTTFLLILFLCLLHPLLSLVGATKAIVILGQKLSETGSLSTNCKNRVVRGLELYQEELRQNWNSRCCIILTGGKTSEFKDSEAKVMKAELLRVCNDIDVDNIIMEEQAKNTIENALNCLSIVKSRGIDILFLVTSDFHIPRSEMVFNYVFKGHPCVIRRQPALSTYKQQHHPRQLPERPANREEWFLSELLEIEANATQALDRDLAKYQVSEHTTVDREKTSLVLAEITELKKKSQRPSRSDSFQVSNLIFLFLLLTFIHSIFCTLLNSRPLLFFCVSPLRLLSGAFC